MNHSLNYRCDDDFELDKLLVVFGEVADVGEAEYIDTYDTYLDTRGRCLAKAGLAGRCRREGRRREVDVAPVAIVPRLVMAGGEVGTSISQGEDPGRVLCRLVDEELGLKVRGFPKVQVVLRTRRRRHHITRDGMRAELFVDEISVRRSRQRRFTLFGEVHVRYLEGSHEAFDEVAGALEKLAPLIPTDASTYARALELLDLPGYVYGAPRPSFAPEDSADEVARAICLGQLRTIQSYESGTRVGLDTEHLHKMRVATRRLRAALMTFSSSFDQRNGDFLRRNFKWLAALLGDIRDLDVHQLDLRRWRQELGEVEGAGWERLGEVLKARWISARKRLLDAMATRRYQRLLERAEEAFLHTPRRRPGHPGLTSVGRVAAAALRRRGRQLRKAIRAAERTEDPEAVHALRIVGKKVRYTIEFFRPLLSPRFGRAVKRLARFQDELGLFQDSVVAGLLARELRDAALAEGDAPSYIHVLGLLLGSSLMGATFGQVKAKIALDALGGQKLLVAAREEARRLEGALLEEERVI
ncbi:MAG: CHAD domain-containing protein [Deltaproteobacteria bacterium]|nr:CHAD domain-containing protein [Deltaproteobacteria bacterium]